eukprot:TRINITY_DN9571_c0_g1_i1.p1 TRINITY_DN9571_c0_g1~~TRINITY_DN9571_c0_g1_i1.p1  ORF type:complete len:1161 (+),score=399.22 TRINITY_DN9571_c0_g1_i1:76-3558(+)
MDRGAELRRRLPAVRTSNTRCASSPNLTYNPWAPGAQRPLPRAVKNVLSAKVPKPKPYWVSNVLFLALTFSAVDVLVAIIWPEELRLAALLPGRVEYSPAGVLAVLTALFAASLWLLYSRSRARAVPPESALSADAAPEGPPESCPLHALTPLEEDREAFRRVVNAEWAEIAAARRARGHSVSEPVRALCFSGGGIRAASFTAGILEEFESNGLLPKMDYLSTVSGGGYTGSAFMTRVRESGGSVRRMVARMQANSDYLGVSGKEGNTLAAVDFTFSVTATIASNLIGLLAYSVVFAEYVNFVLLWVYEAHARENMVYFLVSDNETVTASGSSWNLDRLQHISLLWGLGALLSVSLLWVIVYGLYSASIEGQGVQQRITTRCVQPLRAREALEGIAGGRLSKLKAMRGDIQSQLSRFSMSSMDLMAEDDAAATPAPTPVPRAFPGSVEPAEGSSSEDETAGTSPTTVEERGKRTRMQVELLVADARLLRFEAEKHDGSVVLRSIPAAAPERLLVECGRYVGCCVSTLNRQSVTDHQVLAKLLAEMNPEDRVTIRFAHGPMVSVKQVLAYLSRTGIVLGICAVLTVALLHAMRWQLPPPRCGVDAQQIEERNSLFLSVEAAGALAFAAGHMLASNPGGGDKPSALGATVGTLLSLAPVAAALLLVARIIIWRVLGCPFLDDPELGCSGGSEPLDGIGTRGCGHEVSQPYLLATLFYVLLHASFIKEPLGHAIHNMYRRRLIGSFYKDRRDKLFQDIPCRPYFICNTSLNNMSDYRLSLGVRTTHPFFLSKLFCGSPLTGYRASSYLQVFLSKGMAISGAALSTQFDSLATAPVKMAMLLTGIDLGEWFRFRGNSVQRHFLVQFMTSIPFVLLLFACACTQTAGPVGFLSTAQKCLTAASTMLFMLPFPFAVWQGLILQLRQERSRQNGFLHLPLVRHFYHFFGFLSWRSDPYFYLADGGWFDFLGIYEVLRRGVTEIFVFDCNSDQHYWKDLLDSLTLAKRDLGVEIDMSPADGVLADVLKQTRGVKDGVLAKHSRLHFRVTYPPARPGEPRKVCDVWYGKLGLSGDEPAAVKIHASADKDFPHHSTVTNQDFDNVTFDAYRLLGRHIASRVHSDWRRGHGPLEEKPAGADDPAPTEASATPVSATPRTQAEGTRCGDVAL